VRQYIDRVQQRLRRRQPVAKPSTYVEFSRSTMDKAAFLSEVLSRTGCGLLPDANNVYVSRTNRGKGAQAFIGLRLQVATTAAPRR
jgi:uncharacterized protein